MKHLILFLIFLINVTLYPQTTKDSIDDSLNDILKESDLPGFAVAIVKSDGIVYQNGFGYSNLKTNDKFTINSVQTIASISKSLIGISVMQLVEQGVISFDTEINEILPFSVYNPYHPKTPITVKHLATHTSSITDGEFAEKNIIIIDTTYFSSTKKVLKDYEYLHNKNKNRPMSMGEYLKNALYINGEWYNKENFLETIPGIQYEYSNTAAALLAYIIELKTDLTFAEYTKRNILNKLNMKSSSWTYDKIQDLEYATLYSINKNPLPEYRNITYPDGDLLTCIDDLSKLLLEVLKGFNGIDTPILSSSSMKKMLSPQIPQYVLPESYKDHKGNYGILWQINPRGMIGLNGSTPGSFAYMFFNPDKNIGRIFITNITATQDDDLLKQAIEVIRTLGNFEDRF